jgi:hypothetical protein
MWLLWIKNKKITRTKRDSNTQPRKAKITTDGVVCSV